MGTYAADVGAKSGEKSGEKSGSPTSAQRLLGEEKLSTRYAAVRHMTEQLAAPLTPEDCMLQSMPDASPAKWHLAHTAWFFETFILYPRVPGYTPLDPQYTYLYNSYYKQVGSHPPRGGRGLMSRPTLAEVHAYRRHVDEHMLRLLEVDSIPPEIAALVETGLNHEQQHQELIVTDVKHGLWSQPLRPTYLDRDRNPARTPNPVSFEFLNMAGGLQWVGHADAGFAFDNESPRHQVYLREFRIASRLVTNGEYLDFMRDGGYSKPELWLSDGWDAVNANQWQAPLYWEPRASAAVARWKDARDWRIFTLAGWRDVDPNEPVSHISYYEADAYARWAGARLPTESEWEIVANRVAVEGNFLEDQRFHPRPAPPASEVPVGKPAQVFGDLWEWTSSAYLGYPGYHASAGALGEYNGKFMSGQMVLRGGSCATPASHIRATYRNFFQPYARWQFMGIRLANECS
jgi:ergothioneine biosynthesis protein EgtB